MKIETEDGFKAEHSEIATNYAQGTFLSVKEAELYVLTEIVGLTVSDAAEEMGISYGNASSKRSRIRDKIEKAEKTAELDI